MSKVEFNQRRLSEGVQFTARHPKVHKYNPITHLDRNPFNLSFDAQKPKSPYHLQGMSKPLFPERRFERSVPRTIFTDPLTGRIVDVSQVTPKRTTLVANGANVLGVSSIESPKITQSIKISPRAAKTRVKSQVFDPITGTTAQFSPSSNYISSIGPRGIVSPPIHFEQTRLERDEGKEVKMPLVYQRKKKGVKLAYLSPYQF